MALPSPKFYTSTGGEITTHDFGSVEAGAYKPGSTGWSFRLYNDYGGSLSSDDATSVKISIRDDDGGTDEVWTQQHWIQIKSDGGSTGLTDDAQTVFTAVGKNKELSLGDIPSGEYRTLYARCYPPTDATEQDVDFQLRVTYQNPQTSISNWITGLRGNGVVASTGDPFAMSTGGSTGTIPYEGGYALNYNNELYFGSSGDYDISTTGSGTYTIYLSESGAFNETTGDTAVNELPLYEATISSGICEALTDKRVYLAGLQAGTTGAMPATPDFGDLYLDISNGVLYGSKTAGSWYSMCPHTFLSLTDTPADFLTDASKILRVNSSSGAVEFVSSTGILIDNFGDAEDNTDLNATTGTHGLLLKMTGTATDYLSATGGWTAPINTFVGLSDTPANYTGDASKLLTVTTGESAVEFTSSTGIKLSAFAPTNSAELAGVISDETGSSGLVFANTPTLVTPELGVATATSINANSSGGLALYEDGGKGIFVADGGDITCSTGNVSMPGGQITFPATQNASADANTLDDHEEGTWDVAVTCSVSGGYTVDAAYNSAAYIKTGKLCHVQGLISITGEDSPDGTIHVSLPFTCVTLGELAGSAWGSATLYLHGETITNGVQAYVANGSTFFLLSTVDDAGNKTNLTEANVDTAWYLGFNFSYITTD